ncbi:MAG: hypothetical protein HQM09_15015 [Candidatus Riflebacteria bacterium]|nr:hypothetical protein [Candidatus Riflebacteria bacterium]
MRLKKPYIAKPHEVKITVDGEYANIEYVEKGVSGVNLKIGPEIHEMTMREILDAHNRVLLAMMESARNYDHVAVEIPKGKPQIEYSERSDQWIPRGAVLRCLIDSGEDNEGVVSIDERELTMREFGRLLCTYAGWGMRIVFVPEDDIDVEPRIEVREPDENGL